MVTLEVAKTLEERGKTGKVVMIDGSPLFFKCFTEFLGHADTSDEHIQDEILTSLVRLDFPENYQEIMENTLSEGDWEAKLESFIKFYDGEKSFNKKYSKEWIIALFRRFKMAQTLNEDSFPHLNSSKMTLVVPSEKLVPDIADNYNLNQFCSQIVEILVLNGNHVSVLHNAELPKFINSLK